MTPIAQKRGMPPLPSIPHSIFLRSLDANHDDVRSALTDLHVKLSGTFAPDMLARAELILAEIMNNIVKHGHPIATSDAGPRHAHLIHLSVAGHGGGLACAVSDYGPPLPPSVFETSGFQGDASTPAHDWPEGGFGWLLIRDLTRSLTYLREGDRNLLVFNVPLEENAPRN